MQTAIPTITNTPLDSTLVASTADATSLVDTLTTVVATPAVQPTELFGPEAVVVARDVAGELAPFAPTENPVMAIALIAIFIAYVISLCSSGSQIGQMLKIAAGNNLGIRIADELSYLYTRATRNLRLLGVAVLSAAVVKWLDMNGIVGVGNIGPLLMFPLIVVAICAVWLYQSALTRGICTLVRRDDVATALLLLGETTMALTTLFGTPVVLLFAANTGTTTEAFGIATIAVASIALLLFVLKSLIFFVEQKISILLWFLYLCTAILIPIGIVATLVVRNGVG